MRDLLFRDKCVKPVRLLRGERAMSLRYGCSRLRVVRAVKDFSAARDGFASSSSSCEDCCWMNPESSGVRVRSVIIHSNRLQKAYTCTSDAGPAQVKGFNARHPGADTQDGQIVDICLGQR